MIVSFRVCVARHAQSTQNNRLTISFKENVKDEVDFLPADKRRRFLQSDTFTLCVAKHAHITQNKFAISLQHLKKDLSDTVDFLRVDKHESLLQIDAMILVKMVNCFHSSQNSKFARMSLQYLKKRLEIKLTFCMQINIKVSYKLILTLWASKFLARWYYQWAWSMILKVLKVKSLQYLYNISKKKLGMEFIFCMQINIKTSTTLKSGASHKWFDESSKLTERFLHGDGNCIIFGLTTNLLCIFDICWVPTAVVIAKNDVLLLVPTRKVFEHGFPKCFLIKAWLSVERLFPV